MNNLKLLIKNINKFPIRDNKINFLLPLLEKYKGDDWKEYKDNTDEEYIKRLVYNNKEYEMFIVSWMPYKKSTIHDHSENGCLYKILEGNLDEEKYSFDKSLKLLEKTKHREGDINYIDNDTCLHRMVNNTNKIVHSLHIYSPPNYSIKSYEKD